MLWHFLIILLNKHGEEQAGSASAEGEHTTIPMFGATRNWFGQIGVEKDEVNGKPTTLAVVAVIPFPTAKFSVGSHVID